MPTTWSILTATTAPGAIAIILLSAPTGAELDQTLDRLGLTGAQVGTFSLRNLLGIDTGIAARWTDRTIHLMPHGGIGVLRGIARSLLEAGIAERWEPGAREVYPEAASDLEARMLSTLARAASPLAIDLLLDQPRRWGGRSDSDPFLDRTLNRLVDPPLVVAVGPPNIGKSTLVNVLAGRAVSIVADEPGTTRDHVGVMLDLGGLVVRYLDTPGMRLTDDPIEFESQRIAAQAAAAADLLLVMSDAGSAEPSRMPWNAWDESLRVSLRSDLGVPSGGHDLAISAKTGQGLPELVSLIRERLVPRSAREDPRPWRF